MKKKLVSVMLILVVLFSFALPVVASEIYVLPQAAEAADYQEITPLWEETEWVFRVQDGRLYQRLWSITRGRWMTDWILVAW